jgi:hypothetical protein
VQVRRVHGKTLADAGGVGSQFCGEEAEDVTKFQVLLLLQKLLRDASISKTDPDDQSGLSTVWFVDHEILMTNIETAIQKYP